MIIDEQSLFILCLEWLSDLLCSSLFCKKFLIILTDADVESVKMWDWSWQLHDCELHRLKYIDRIVTSLHRKKKCALLSLCKDWLTKHTSYTQSCKELSVLADWSELTVVFSLYVSHSHDIYAAGSLLKKLLCKKKNSE